MRSLTDKEASALRDLEKNLKRDADEVEITTIGDIVSFKFHDDGYSPYDGGSSRDTTLVFTLERVDTE